MTTVALMGASGFVGRLTQSALESYGAKVVVVRAPRLSRADRPSAKELSDLYPDIIDDLTLAFTGVDAVVNAAGDPDASSNDVARLYGANAVLPGLVGLACVRAQVGRLIHVSSAVVQGRRAQLDESLETDPFSEYAQSKVLGEASVLECAPHITTIYRPPSVHADSRRVTRTLTRLATSVLSTVAGDPRPTPQALGDNVGSAIAFLATTSQLPPRVVSHPSEGLTTRSLLELLGGRAPRSLPTPLADCALTAATWLEPAHPKIAANVRRVEMVWFGQSQAPSWLTAAGWVAPVGPEGWVALGRKVRQDLSGASSTSLTHGDAQTGSPRILFGVTTGIVVKSFFSGQFAMLRDAGWRVTLVTTDLGDARQIAETEQATFVPIDAVRDPSPRHDLSTFVALVRLLHREQPNLAVWGTPKFGLLGPIASRLTGVPSVYVLHGLRLQTATGLKRIILSWAERIACASANDVVAVSHDLREEAIRLRLTTRRHIRVLGDGSANGVMIRAKSSEPRRAMRLPDEGIIVSFVGRITRDKGIVELLKAWPYIHAHTSATLVLAGMREPDADQDPIRSLLAETPGIVELGHLNDLSDLYSATDVLVLPSYREGYPSVVLEAAAYGAPAVVTNATGLRESVRHDLTGVVVDIGDVSGLATALRSLIDDDDRRQEMGQAALDHAQKYDRRTVHHNWLTYFAARRTKAT